MMVIPRRAEEIDRMVPAVPGKRILVFLRGQSLRDKQRTIAERRITEPCAPS